MGLKNFIVNGQERTLNYETGLSNKPDVYTKTQTDAKISEAINNLVNGAEGALDTLGELAEALGNDENFSTTITNELASKASKDVATTTSNGLMSAADKTKLDNISSNGVGTVTQVKVGDTAYNPTNGVISLPKYAKSSELVNYTLSSEFNEEVDRLDGLISAITGSGGGGDVPTLDNVYTKTQTDNAINTAITGLVDGAPGALNTLKELSTALGDDANFATTITNKITEKVDKTTTINDKPLDNNITLTKDDIGLGNVLDVVSYSKEEIDDLLENISGVNSTDTSTKIYLIGATSQSAAPNTYSDNEVYVTNGVLTTKKVQVGGGFATMEYDSSLKALKFVFA